MSYEPHRSHGLQLAARMANAFRFDGWVPDQIDPDGLQHVGSVSVRVHWFFAAVLLAALVYRPASDGVTFSTYVLLFGLLVGLNVYTHYRLQSGRTVTWRLILALCAADVFIISTAVTTNDGFSDSFFFPFYHLALVWFALLFTSFRLTLAWVTAVAVVYVAISLTAGDGLDVEAGDEKTLLVRVAIMYGIIAAVNLVSRFERRWWRRTLERERTLQGERAELTQAIHDTTAQYAYMVGLGIDSARALSGNASPELATTLEATSQLARSMIWELRHPINTSGGCPHAQRPPDRARLARG